MCLFLVGMFVLCSVCMLVMSVIYFVLFVWFFWYIGRCVSFFLEKYLLYMVINFSVVS